MNGVLSTRLKRLERHSGSGNAYGHLTDQELDARIEEVTARIEAEVGMPIQDYVVALTASVEQGGPLPEGMTKADIQSLLAWSWSGVGAGNGHVQ